MMLILHTGRSVSGIKHKRRMLDDLVERNDGMVRKNNDTVCAAKRILIDFDTRIALTVHLNFRNKRIMIGDREFRFRKQVNEVKRRRFPDVVNIFFL